MRRFLRFGDDGGDGFPLPAHAILGQHRFVVRPDADEAQDGVDVVGHILVGQVGDKAAHLFRL